MVGTLYYQSSRTLALRKVFHQRQSEYKPVVIREMRGKFEKNGLKEAGGGGGGGE